MDVIHTDQFEYNGTQYLAVYDQMSCYTWMYKLTQTNTNNVFTQLDIIQSMFGKVKKLVIDNGSNLSSKMFENYCQQNRIDHQTSAPRHPEGNSISEISVELPSQNTQLMTY